MFVNIHNKQQKKIVLSRIISNYNTLLNQISVKKFLDPLRKLVRFPELFMFMHILKMFFR